MSLLNKPVETPEVMSFELDPEKVAVGASFILNLLQRSCYCKNLCNGLIGSKSGVLFNEATKLSAVARGLCRKPGEVIAMCLEARGNNLTAIIQYRVHENNAKVESQSSQGDDATLRSMKADHDGQNLLQEMKEQDTRRDFLRLLRKFEPSAALKLAIRQTC